MKVALPLVAMAVLVYFAERGTATDKKNSADFRALCHAYTLYEARDSITTGTPPETTANVLQIIEDYNTSTASDTWYANKDGTMKNPTGEPDANAQAAWDKHKQSLLEKETNGKKIYERLKMTTARAAANAKIQKALQRAKNINEALYNAAASYLADIASIKSKLTSAVFGKETAAIDAAAATGDWGARCSPNGGGGGLTISSSLALAITCLCSEKAGKVDNCGVGSVSQWKDATNNKGEKVTELWQALRTKCNTYARPKQLNPNAIYAAIAGVMARMGQGNSQDAPSRTNVIGETSDSNCDGSTTKLCLDYETALGSAGGGIKWINDLQEAANLINNATATAIEAKRLQQLMDLERQRAEDAYTDAVHVEYQTQTPTTVKIENKALNQQQAQKDCDKHHASQENCTKAQCDYDENAADGKKCKPKAEAETTAVGTGDGETKCGSQKCLKKQNEDSNSMTPLFKTTMQVRHNGR
uniref:Variant surface glycoprotein 1125.1133 n=1 Tax=Trypanosoma brucei TaxID=5691 RepID=A0A1J0R6A3_9TRYP|nr:variant surface glycoprotein 1125.1133 [Trypanosoma brucei]